MADKHLATESDVKGDTLSHNENLEYGDVSDGPKMVNVLRGIPKSTLFESVEAFTRNHGLDEYTDVFKRGALVAQKPTAFDQMDELSADDKTALRYEIDHKWKQTFPLYFTVVVCAIGAACQGWDQTGSNGASKCGPAIPERSR